MEHNDEMDAKDQREHDAQAGVGASADDLGTHDLDLDDFDDLLTGDDPLKTDADDEGDLTTDEPTDADEKDPPFHEHPRWQEMIKERDDLKEELEGVKGTMEEQTQRIDQYDRHVRMMEQFQPQAQPEPTPESTKHPFDDVLALDETEIFDEFQKDPKGFLTGFGDKMRADSLKEFRQEAAYQDQEKAIAQGIDNFAEENPDFMDMVSSGKIARFIEVNPIHNAISAFHLLQAADSSVDDTKAKEELETQIREDERKKVLESMRAKQGAQVLDGATSSGPQAGASTAVAPELQDTEQHGGKRAVLAGRLKALRERF